MLEGLVGRVHEGGFLMYPLMLLAALSPVVSLGFYVLGLLMKDKAWALRFAVVNLFLGIGVPVLVAGYSTWQADRLLGRIKGTVSEYDWPTIETAARAEMLALPWGALLSSPWFVLSGFGLVGVALTQKVE
jgi:hypothetical protein